jgi:preprotein translocase subunit SecF
MQEKEGESLFEKIDITNYPMKKLIAIPLIILLISFAVLTYTYMQPPVSPHAPHSPVHLGLDFTGGTMVKIRTNETSEELTTKFSAYPDVLVGKTDVGNEKMIRFGPMSESQKEALEDMLDNHYAGHYEIPKSMDPVFGEQFRIQALYALTIAFLLMAIVVFVVFRTFIPPIAVIFAAFSDIVIAVACMDIVGLELSLGTVAALLMLIGYSVDSNILLTTNLLRKKGDLNEKVRNAMKTGITMTFTTLSAVFAMFIVSSSIHFFSSHFAPIPILRDISVVLLFGLVMDLMNTWLLNAGILRWYIEEKERKRYGKRGVGKERVKKKK